MPETHSAFTDSETLIRTLDAAESAPEAVALRQHTYAALRRGPGAVLLDVGCGTGRAVAELGPGAIGVDLDPAMLDAARARFPGIDVREADVNALPLADGSVHGYRADKVFHMLPDPAVALAEARRVLAPGGRIVLVGQDWDTIVVDSAHPELTRRIVHARAGTIPQPRVARAYRNLLLEAGFHEAELVVHTLVLTDATALGLLTNHAEAARRLGAITDTEAGAWLADQSARADTDRLMVAVPMFLAAATN
ncbi:methyltransferase domain-containing protein [Actinoplanes sp. LDG1-06]|uniref:Methyltransferase domain-containing protein n=1 Tax=Paractinoplanes ovalisporus TaxID=2810368 RepID=A0ABS2AMG1_9ACTN|nr:methyltransferase domain-containing protein [Actinoplanes ovalisporus]MBM2621009.1 methyltransferase domain-containing protein [Actinoplanes ovalisporus]